MSARAITLVLALGLLANAATAAPAKAVRKPVAQIVPLVTPAKPAGSRTLEDIHIEGEIPVPQVLFITARDQRRFMEFQHRRYLRTSRQLGEATPLPSRVVLNRVTPTQAKEPSR